MKNPLSNIDGTALRGQSKFLLNLRQYGMDQMGEKAVEALDGLINLLDEIRSYCHDEYGIDCLLLDPETKDRGDPCAVCGNTRCLG